MVVPGNTFQRPDWHPTMTAWHPTMTATAWKEQFCAAKGSNFHYSISWVLKLKAVLPTTIDYSWFWHQDSLVFLPKSIAILTRSTFVKPIFFCITRKSFSSGKITMGALPTCTKAERGEKRLLLMQNELLDN
jgi:hypothetical protein